MPSAPSPDTVTVGVAIPAAGTGVRMGGVRKPFLELGGEPLLLRVLRPFLEHPKVVAVAVALGEDDVRNPPAWLADLDPRVRLVKGGASRGSSVWSAIQALPPEVHLVAIHDAARPLVTRDVIDRCFGVANRDRGAVAGWPAVDTLKQVGGGNEILSTLTRAEVWHAQTPQVFPREMIVKAYREAMEVGGGETDDAAVVERMGGQVVMVRGSPSNLKVTRPEDLPLAEFLLERGEA